VKKKLRYPRKIRTCGAGRDPVVLVPDRRGRPVVRVPVLFGIDRRVETHGRRLALRGEVHAGREPHGLHLSDSVGHRPGRSSTVYRRRFRRGDPHFDAVVRRHTARAVGVLLLLLAFQNAPRLVPAVLGVVFRCGRLTVVVRVHLQDDFFVHVVSEPVLGQPVVFLGRTIVPETTSSSRFTIRLHDIRVSCCKLTFT